MNRDFEKISLKKFKLKNLLPNATILLLGRRRSGKSFLAKDIFYHHRDIPQGIIFSGTETANPFYGDFIPDTFIHSDYIPSVVANILTKQSVKVSEARKKGINVANNGCSPDNRFFVVLDDMLADATAWKREKTIKEIFLNGRHYNIFFILTMQYPLGIPPELRSNIDYVFIFNEPNINNRKKIYEGYGGMLPSFDHFQNLLDSCTQDHECLVIKTCMTSSALEDQIFWYKAAPHDSFQVGHPKIWEYHNNKYNMTFTKEEAKDNENIDRMKKKYIGTPRKLKVLVNRQFDVLEVSNQETRDHKSSKKK